MSKTLQTAKVQWCGIDKMKEKLSFPTYKIHIYNCVSCSIQGTTSCGVWTGETMKQAMVSGA
jgi:hypothetical protein